MVFFVSIISSHLGEFKISFSSHQFLHLSVFYDENLFGYTHILKLSFILHMVSYFIASFLGCHLSHNPLAVFYRTTSCMCLVLDDSQFWGRLLVLWSPSCHQIIIILSGNFIWKGLFTLTNIFPQIRASLVCLYLEDI